MKKKSAWVWILAGITAVAGAAVAIALFLKKAGKRLQSDMEFDDDIYFEDDSEDLIELDGAEEGEETLENAAEEAADAVEDLAADAADAVEDLADDVGDAVEDFVDDMKKD